MKIETLAEICEINPKYDHALSSDVQCSFVPMEFVDDAFSEISRTENRKISEVQKGYTPFRDGDVILAKITPCLENGKCALAANLTNGIGFGSTEFHVLRASDVVIPKWLYYFVRQESVRTELKRQMHGSAGQQRVPGDAIERLKILIPSLPEQQRIAALLDRADHLRRTRRYAQQLSDSFLQAVFLEMFWQDKGGNWTDATIESLAKGGKNSIRTGPFGSQLKHSEFVDSGIRVLGIDNAVSNRFAWGKPRFISKEKYKELKRYTVYPGDVIITIMATTGRCAVIPENFPPAINTKHLCCITLNQQKCLPVYLQQCFLNHPRILKQLGISARGAIMPGLNMEIIKNLVMPLPPLPLQQKFARIVQQFERLRAQQREAERQADHLFQTLLHRAFTP